MRLRVVPGGRVSGDVNVPGDKSIAHRWLILAATAKGVSRLHGLPCSLDVRSTAASLARVTGRARPALDAWVRDASAQAEGNGSTWNTQIRPLSGPALEVEGEGREDLVAPDADLDCGNSGTAMRLLSGVLAAAPFRARLIGDDSLSARPMERIAVPLREMGAIVRTSGGRPPIQISGGPLRGIRYRIPVPSAQVKSAILLAGLAAEGETVVEETAPTRDHTERALAHLGAPVLLGGTSVAVRRFQHGGFEATVPGDPSSAAFLIAAAALTGSGLTIGRVGLNPTRLHFLAVMRRMGIPIEATSIGHSAGEPFGDLQVLPAGRPRGTTISKEELPLVIDEVPVLALLGSHAEGETWFLGAGELRSKESDRLTGVARGIRGLGGHASDEGDDLVVGGTGLAGGTADAIGDHRLAMAFAVAALGASGPCEIEGIDSALVSFPGFVATLRSLGAKLEER